MQAIGLGTRKARLLEGIRLEAGAMLGYEQETPHSSQAHEAAAVVLQVKVRVFHVVLPSLRQTSFLVHLHGLHIVQLKQTRTSSHMYVHTHLIVIFLQKSCYSGNKRNNQFQWALNMWKELDSLTDSYYICPSLSLTQCYYILWPILLPLSTFKSYNTSYTNSS